MIEQAVFQDKCDFPFQIPINTKQSCLLQRKKGDVSEENLYHQSNTQSHNVIGFSYKMVHPHTQVILFRTF